MSNECNIKKLIIIRNKFLCCTPVLEIDLKKNLQNLSWSDQELLLEFTVKNNLLKDYPIRVSYQKVFLKSIIDIVEKNGDDIHDDIYDTYCALLNKIDEEIFCYKHYIVDEKVITLKESKNFISDGTTGLCSWQASLALSQWCINNKKFLKNKRILELGSGIGLLGLTVALFCQSKEVYLTDCHSKVLEILSENVQLNVTGKNLVHNCSNRYSIESNVNYDQTINETSEEKITSFHNRETVKKLDTLTNCDVSSTSDVSDKVNNFVDYKFVEQTFGSKSYSDDIGCCVKDSASGSANISESNEYKIIKVIDSENTELNIKQSDLKTKDNKDICVKEDVIDNSSEIFVSTVANNSATVHVVNLPWENINKNPSYSSIQCDLILAADVVYDNSVFEPLCSVVKHFLKKNLQCQAMFACTERNPDTLQEFLDLLRNNNFHVQEIKSPESVNFFWTSETPIRLFQIALQ